MTSAMLAFSKFMDMSGNPWYYVLMVSLLIVLIIVWRVMKNRGAG